MAVSDTEPAMAPERFVLTSTEAGNADPDFTTDSGALQYAENQIGKLFAAMRYSIGKQVAGWPGDDRALNTIEAIRHLIRVISLGHSAYMEADYENPMLTKLQSTNRGQWQLPSPDCVYHNALLHGDYRYRLRGFRGTAAVLQTTVYSGHACSLAGWKSYGKADSFDTPAYAPGKTVDVVLSRAKPDDLEGATWLEMPEGPCELQVRQYYSDWDTQQPANLVLTRDSQTFPSTSLNRQTSEQRFKRLTDLVRIHSDYYRAGVQSHLDSGTDEIAEIVIPGAFEGTNYFNGHFRCRPKEAVIIEIKKPQALYWNVALYQLQWEAGDWWTRQSSLNIHQARADSDGRIRLVASWSDPGVPNWLDCSDRVLSLIGFRFFKSPATPGKPRLTTVPLGALREHLPTDTPAVTPDERHAQLTRRLASVFRRGCTDY